MVSISQFKDIYSSKYQEKMPVHRFLFEFPTARFEDLTYIIKYLNLKVEDGFVVSRESS